MAVRLRVQVHCRHILHRQGYVLQQWHTPPKGTANPASVSNIKFRRAEYGKEQEEHPKPTTYDPRHPNGRALNSEQGAVLLENLKSARLDWHSSILE